MPIPYEKLFTSNDIAPRASYMRLPSYQSLRRQRYHPYRTTRTRSMFSNVNMMELGVDFEDVLSVRVNENPVSLSLPIIPEDDYIAGLRTVVSQMLGRDNVQLPLGFVHLVIDFALTVRGHLRAVVRNEAAVALPPLAPFV